MLALMHRIFFDTNEALDCERYALWLPQSLEDLAKVSDQLRDGLRVVIYMTGELEMEARLEFDKAYGAWTAHPIAGTQKDYY